MKRFRITSLHTALIVRFVAAAILPLLVFGWYGYRHQLEQKTTDIALDLQGHALTISAEIEGFVEELQYELKIARATIALLRNQPAGQIDMFLKALTEHADYFEAVYLLDAKGRVQHVGLSPGIAVDRRDYQAVDFSRLELLNFPHNVRLAADRTCRWSDILASPLTGKPSIMLAIELSDGMLLGTVALDRISPILRRRVRQNEAMAFALVDHHGTLIAHTDERLALERSNIVAVHPEILGALATGDGVSPRLHEDESMLESVSVIPETGWIIHASVPREYILAQTRTLQLSLAGAVVWALLLGGGLAAWMARRLGAPLRELRQGAQQLADGQVSEFRMSRRNYVEIEELYGHLHDMAAAVLERETFLKAGEERYRSVVANLGEGLMIIAPGGVVEDCNPSAERILGRSRRDLVGRQLRSDFDSIYREDGSPVAPEDYPVMASLQRGEVVENQLIGMRRADGLELWLQVNSRPQLAGDGTIVAAVVTFTDVTGLKLVEESLRRGKERFEELYQQFQALLEGISDRISLISMQMHILWTNQEAGSGCIANSGVSEGDCCYQQFFGRAETCPGCPVVRCFASAESAAEIMTDNNGRVWSLRAFPVMAASVEGGVRQVVLMAEDVTDKRLNEQRQMRANQLAALGELAAGVAHEINNPISGVINYAQLIVNYTPEESREHDLARRIIKEGDRIANIVRELLIFARTETHEVQILSVREALAEALTLCEAALRKEQITMKVDLPASLPPVESRSHQVQQLLLNLLVNARHALSEKYPQADADKLLEIRGEPISIEGRTFVRIRVRDHGSGIPAEVLDRVMNPFFTTKPAGVGTGLGLSISFEIAKRHGGSLQLFSEHGQWTEAVVELPAAE